MHRVRFRVEDHTVPVGAAPSWGRVAGRDYWQPMAAFISFMRSAWIPVAIPLAFTWSPA
jgi:hypothetical protein